MDMRGKGVTRRDIRGGAGGGADEHFYQMVGATELNIYRHYSSKIAGLEPLQQYLVSQGCKVEHLTDEPAPVGPGYQTIRVTHGGAEIPVMALRRAHNWAHRRNLLHLFRKPGFSARLPLA